MGARIKPFFTTVRSLLGIRRMSWLAPHLLNGLGCPLMFESNNGTGDRHNLFSYDESFSLGIYKADRPGWQCQRVYTTLKSSSGS